jgi:hypothetical protein
MTAEGIDGDKISNVNLTVSNQSQYQDHAEKQENPVLEGGKSRQSEDKYSESVEHDVKYNPDSLDGTEEKKSEYYNSQPNDANNYDGKERELKIVIDRSNQPVKSKLQETQSNISLTENKIDAGKLVGHDFVSISPKSNLELDPPPKEDDISEKDIEMGEVHQTKNNETNITKKSTRKRGISIGKITKEEIDLPPIEEEKEEFTEKEKEKSSENLSDNSPNKSSKKSSQNHIFSGEKESEETNLFEFSPFKINPFKREDFKNTYEMDIPRILGDYWADKWDGRLSKDKFFAISRIREKIKDLTRGFIINLKIIDYLDLVEKYTKASQKIVIESNENCKCKETTISTDMPC